jgi:hypothetical protein
MKEVRAVVLGLVIVVLVAVAIAVWRRPARQFHRVGGYRVEIQKNEGGSRRHVSFTVPISLVARVVSFMPRTSVGGDIKADWGDGEISARDILDAAARSEPGKPAVLTRDHSHVEVTAEGAALEIVVKDEWDRTVRVRVPRVLVESLSAKKSISAQDVLRRLDELGPGDVVTIHDGENEVTITAQAR